MNIEYPHSLPAGTLSSFFIEPTIFRVHRSQQILDPFIYLGFRMPSPPHPKKANLTVGTPISLCSENGRKLPFFHNPLNIINTRSQNALRHSHLLRSCFEHEKTLHTTHHAGTSCMIPTYCSCTIFYYFGGRVHENRSSDLTCRNQYKQPNKSRSTTTTCIKPDRPKTTRT